MRVLPPSVLNPVRLTALRQLQARIFGLPQATATASPAALKVLDQPLIGKRLNEWHYPDIDVVEVANRDKELRQMNFVDMDLEKRRVKEVYRKSRNSKLWNESGLFEGVRSLPSYLFTVPVRLLQSGSSSSLQRRLQRARAVPRRRSGDTIGVVIGASKYTPLCLLH